ncbi:MAG: tRNA 2-thiouridine(34) synthase MnmA [Candidatus Peribacteraceae bacterium]|jgi:tRNA-specific 2-thiouridylase
MSILIALSGGIDSSVVAHLLKEQGHEVVGVRMALWSDPLAPAKAQLLPNKCCDAQAAARTAAVAKKLQIPIHIVEMSKEFKELVVDRFLKDCRNGLTPNPCVYCNRLIKFGKLMDIADGFGCEKVATGHYARIVTETMPNGSVRHALLEAVDKEKDQSYYLHGLNQNQLGHVLFPLGEMVKGDVYALAQRFGIPFDRALYRESQDLCFFPEKSPTEFLRRHAPEAMRLGQIIRRDGMVVGSHQGLPLYTVGQRRGLKIGGLKIPLEVVAKDVSGNRLIVDEKDKEKAADIPVRDITWVCGKPAENADTPFDCRTRSLSPKRKGTFRFTGSSGTFTLAEPAGPQSPGQYLVLYSGEEVVGGGVIA